MAAVQEQRDEVASDETLYRRIHPNMFSRSKNRPAFSQFMPREWKSDEQRGDVDGLSVSRASITPLAVAARCRHTGREFPVATLETRFVRSLGLSVQPKPVQLDSGHAVIPEMNSIARRRSEEAERWMEERAKKLRDHATMISIPPE